MSTMLPASPVFWSGPESINAECQKADVWRRESARRKAKIKQILLWL